MIDQMNSNRIKEISNLFWHQDKVYRQLAPLNGEAIEEFNAQMLSALTRLGMILTMLALAVFYLGKNRQIAFPVYWGMVLSYMGIFWLYRIPRMRRHLRPGLYAVFSIMFLLTMYFSLIDSPHMRATLLLGAFCIMPLGFIDRPLRMNLFAAFWLVLHTGLAFVIKPGYAMDDAVNSLTFAILGCFLGNMMVRVRIENFDARRLLTIERDTDVLTGLYNRRKLFETIEMFAAKGTERPAGVMMLDIDHFKRFNDSHGHAAGDRFLEAFGAALTRFSQEHRVHFYRYGGEEFVALVYGCSEKELLILAQSLQTVLGAEEAEGRRLTVSIGVVSCAKEASPDYERIIDRADTACYQAKRAGRNTVRMAE